MSRQKYELLIFDWDGTLSDSAALIVGTMQAAIAGLSLPSRTDKEIRELIGLGLNEALQLLYPEFDQRDLRALLDDYRRQWIQQVTAAEAPLFDGVLDALEGFSQAGYRLAIATGKSRIGLDRALVAHERVGALIQHSRCADETASKPDPQMLEELIWEAGVDISRALMIGDTEYDMAMARELRMPAIGVECGVHESQRMLNAGAQLVVADVPAVFEWVQQG